MRRTLTGISLGVAVAAMGFSGSAVAGADPTVLEDVESEAIAFSREEEKMTRDLYTELGSTYDSAVWSRIARSEQRHFDAVGRLLTRYDVEDPTVGREPGEFTDPGIQVLYDDWLERGQVSQEAAFEVAIELEERDIADLTELLALVDNPDIDRVLSALLRGSGRHLEVFTRAADGEPFPGPLGTPRSGERAQGPRQECDDTGAGPRDGMVRRDGMQQRDGSGNPDGAGNADGARRGPRGNR